MVISDDPNHDFPLLYESTHNNSIKGLDLNKYTSGVQVVPLAERIAAYNGNVAIRRVISPCYKQRHQLRLYRTEMVGTPFEVNKLEILASAKHFSLLRKSENLSSVFCSEHHAQALIALGWLNSDIPSNHYCPKDFTTRIEFESGVRYGPIEQIK